jgi:hypothetical protein
MVIWLVAVITGMAGCPNHLARRGLPPRKTTPDKSG